MMYSVEIGYSDENKLECVSDSLQECIDHINSRLYFPGKSIIFSAWKNKKRIATASFKSRRDDSIDGNNKGKFTYDEVAEEISKDIRRGPL